MHKKKSVPIEGVISTTGKGLGFVPHPSFKEDIRIEAGFLNTALHGDLVEVRLRPGPFGAPPAGEVARIVRRKRTAFVGTAERENGLLFVVPDDRHLYIDFIVPQPPEGINDGDKVLVEIVRWNDPVKNPIAEVKEIIGKKGSHEAEIRSIILEKGIDDSFPPEVKKEAEEIHARHATITPDEVRDRKDFRSVPTLTIDPVDAKDFDDALSLVEVGSGRWEVGIHIADVSHYVRPGTSLDAEALKRAFSAYLVDRTIPMLPEVLSNDLCSLKPEVERLAFSAWFVLDARGRVHERAFGKSIIRSRRRFTYEEAQEILNAGRGELSDELSALNSIAKNFCTQRMKAGAIDFEQHEVRFELADDGVPLEAYRKERLDTHKLVEEFMLLANREVADFIAEKFGANKKRHSFIYRVHDTPNKEKIAELANFLKALGYTLRLSASGGVTGVALNELFAKVEGAAEEMLIKTAVLRSMAKAAYAAADMGHFGLALAHYTQFTSPIRRYADLLVHRLLQEALTTGTLPNERWPYFDRVAGDISRKELSIIEAERDSVKYKQVELMSSKVGQEFDAVISGVTEWGIFVEEKETKAEGLIRLAALEGDYYVLEPAKYRIIGRKTKKKYALGDPVRVRLAAADVDRKTLDFMLV